MRSDQGQARVKNWDFLNGVLRRLIVTVRNYRVFHPHDDQEQVKLILTAADDCCVCRPLVVLHKGAEESTSC